MLRSSLLWIAVITMVQATVPQPIQAEKLETVLERMAQELADKLSADLPRPLLVFVPNFEGVRPATGADRADKLAGALAKLTGTFKVLERDEKRLGDAIKEISASMTGLFDPESAPEVGKMLNAQAIVYGKSEMSVEWEQLTIWINIIETSQSHLAEVHGKVRRTRSAGYGGSRSALLPGWGQWACGNRGAGVAFMVSTVGLGGGILHAQGKANAAYDDAVLAGTPAERDRLLRQESDWKNRRNWLMAGLGATWISNVLHAAWVSSRTPIYAQVEIDEGVSVALNLRF